MFARQVEASESETAGMEYQIRVKGHLEDHWSDWLGGMAIEHDAQGYTVLTGIVPDQAALHGILAQIRDLGLTLITISSQEAGDEGQESKARGARPSICDDEAQASDP